MKIFREFELRELFEIVEDAKIQTNLNLLPDSRNDEYKIPVVTGATVNNGISAYALPQPNLIPAENVLTVAQDGVYAGRVFYQPEKFYHGVHAYALKSKKEINKFQYFYLAAAMNKVLSKEYDYTLAATWKTRAQFSQIELPVKDSDESEPDWDYMEEYIKNVAPKYLKKIQEERERHMLNLTSNSDIAKLIGVTDFHISKEDLLLLKREVKFKLSPIKDFFNIYTGTDLIIMEQKKGNIPMISRTRLNNGVEGYIEQVPGRKLFSHKKTITATLISTIWSAVHTKDFYIGTRVKALETKNDIPYGCLQYLSIAINKAGKMFSDYQNRPDDFDQLQIMIPVCGEEDSPDWEFMENYSIVLFKKSVLNYEKNKIEHEKEIGELLEDFFEIN